MQIQFEIEDQASARLESMAGRELSEARSRLIEQAMEQTLIDTLELNPVDTGRSRAAWAAALQQLGVDVQGDWRGPHPDGAAIAEGAAQGTLTRSDDDSTTLINAENGVRYIGFLEYGTRRMAPVAMVRRALAAVQAELGRWFEFPAE